MPADLYDVLGASDDASAKEIKHAYRERVREYHPDVNDHPEGDAQFKLIRKANDVLSDPAERKDYDRLGHREYVEKRLDDLPSVSVFPDEDLPEGVTTESEATDEPSSSASTSTQRTSGSQSTVSANTEGERHSSSTQTSSTSSQPDSTADQSSSTSKQSSTNRSNAGTATETASQTASTTTDTDDRQTTTTGSQRNSWDAATDPQKTTATSSNVSTGVRRRRGLKRWYGVVALSLLVYLGGIGVYAFPRQPAIRELVTRITTAPASGLLGVFPLSSPTVYLLSAARAATVGTAELGLVLLAGAALLPLVVLTTVGRFGRGGAWMYALPSLAPAVCLVAWPSVTVPTVVALLGLVALPTLSGVGFLVDVGRYLRATR